MNYLTLERIKKHLNIDSDFTGDDEYLEFLGDVAEQIAEQHLEIKLEDIAKDYDGNLPAPIIQAMLLFLGTLYMSRETITFGSANQIPAGYTTAYLYLLDPYLSYKNSNR